jgi:uncharacterized protein HemX
MSDNPHRSRASTAGWVLLAVALAVTVALKASMYKTNQDRVRMQQEAAREAERMRQQNQKIIDETQKIIDEHNRRVEEDRRK